MSLLGTLINGFVVAAVGLILAALFHGQFQAMQERFTEVHGRIDRLEARLERRMDGFQASLDAMRSDLTAVALAVGVRPRTGEVGGSRSL